jgi:putative oxidoreductase
MKIAYIIVRSLLGLMLLFASISYFFMKNPPMPVGDVKTYMMGISLVHIMTIVKVIELLCGIAFVTGRFNTLAAVMIFPILINIALFHAYLGPEELPLALVLIIADLFIAYYYRDNYKTLLAAK